MTSFNFYPHFDFLYVLIDWFILSVISDKDKYMQNNVIAVYLSKRRDLSHSDKNLIFEILYLIKNIVYINIINK